MKNQFKYILALLVILTEISCSKDLLDKQPIDKFSETTVWQDLNLVETYVNNQYKVLPKLGWYDWIRAYHMSSFTDEATHKYGYHGINDYWGGVMSPSITTGIDVWSYHYKFIQGCNIFLANIENVPTELTADQEKKDRLTGEILALRAWSYMDLAARYGGVVLVTEPFGLDDDFSRSRSSFDEVLAQVVNDLDTATDLLPLNYTDDNNWGRFTKGAALAIKARMLLYAASPLFNPSGDLEKWQTAANAAKAVIDLNNYDLEPEFKQVFLTNKNNEIILSRGNDAINNDGLFSYFGVVEGLGGGIDGNGYASGWSSTMINQDLVDAFEWNDGTAFDWNNPVDAADPYGIGVNGQIDSEGNPLKSRDPRFYASVTFDGTYWINNAEVEFWVTEESNNFMGSIEDPGFRIDQTVYGNNSVGNPVLGNDTPEISYIYRKSMDPLYNIAEEQYPRSTPWIIIRYAEILLNYAEASFEAGDEGTALTYLNMVRDRVSMPAISASGDELREKIRHERRIELCFETHRFFDARRWKIAHIEFSKPIKGMRVVKDKNSDTKVYNVYEHAQRTWPEQYYLQPIPQYELNRVDLTQNPGYD
ncbi:RagB/SusD family nutrient uptake outer membrane protein [Arenibacter algicola]|uniref:RagB/SusD family nutrient uptake outer membrane protein n=1 Tax=Arenibacter algicola TaxID=616991 RepID=UPI001C072B4A|nr:RagB/SusD family nutrient uptake outer membrane protein [Arenibacter algicola]MBU2903905.1 RagB/SusD family nutrient uptake outer membrane protein [Arenibacter algicola]